MSFYTNFVGNTDFCGSEICNIYNSNNSSFCMSFQINCNIVQIDARLFRRCLFIQENCKMAILVNQESIFFSSRKFFLACQSVNV